VKKENKTDQITDIKEYEQIIKYYSELYVNEYILPLYGNNINGLELLNVINKQFNAMLLYIRKYIPKINYNDLQLLNDIFNLYVELCVKYNHLPTIQGFCFMSNISQNTIDKWKNGYTKLSIERMETIKKWYSICKGFLIDDLNNSDKASINKIFIAKSVYGLNDNINAIQNNDLNVIQAETLPTLAISNKENEND